MPRFGKFRYSYEDQLGKGTYGTVFKLDESSVLKVIKHSSMDTCVPELSELNGLATFNHPCILKLLDFDIQDQDLGLVLPLAKYDLATAIKMEDNRIHIDSWIYQMLSGLYFLHSNGYYHCDIKSTNMLILGDNSLVIADLGLLRKYYVKVDACQTIMSPQLLYNSPHRHSSVGIPGKHPTVVIQKSLSSLSAEDAKIFTEKSSPFQDDVWALGVTILHMLEKYYPLTRVIEVNQFVWYKYYVVTSLALGESNFFKVKSNVPDQYCELLKKLLNPVASERSLNLMHLLELPVLNQFGTDFIRGNIVESPTKDPIVTNVQKYRAIDVFDYIYDSYFRFGVPLTVQVNVFDLIMRTLVKFYIGRSNLKEYALIIINTIVGVSNESCVEDDTVPLKSLIEKQAELLKYIEGRITRLNFSEIITSQEDLSKCLHMLIDGTLVDTEKDVLGRYDQVRYDIFASYLLSRLREEK